jgi:hypothetical protein
MKKSSSNPHGQVHISPAPPAALVSRLPLAEEARHAGREADWRNARVNPRIDTG